MEIKLRVPLQFCIRSIRKLKRLPKKRGQAAAGALVVAFAATVAHASPPTPVPTIPPSVYSTVMAAEMVAMQPNPTQQQRQLSYNELAQLYSDWTQRRNGVRQIIGDIELELMYLQSERREIEDLMVLRNERQQILARMQAIYSGQGTQTDQAFLAHLQQRLVVISEIEQFILSSLPPNLPTLAAATAAVTTTQAALARWRFHLAEIEALLGRLVEDMVRLLQSNYNIGLTAPPVNTPSAPAIAAVPPRPPAGMNPQAVVAPVIPPAISIVPQIPPGVAAVVAAPRV